jgi:CRISPR/Cas system-associated endonuclease/helicase Cas3
MHLITQRNQQESPDYVCEILSEIKDIKYSKVPWTETVIKLSFCCYIVIIYIKTKEHVML